jgi:hypothetical protein
MMLTGEATASPVRFFYDLLLRLALAVRHVGVLASGLRLTLRFRRLFLTLGVFAFAVMFGGSPVALGGGFVMFRRLVMSFPRHAILLLRYDAS